MQTKRVPLRMCTGCGEMKPKKELVRVVKPPEGDICIDRTGKKAGRGAYVCPNTACLQKALRSKALDRSLEVEIPQEIYETLIAQMEASRNE